MTKKTTSPEFISLEEAAKMKEGTRITFIPGIQAIYAEALKNICYVKKIKITRVLHPFMGVDKKLEKIVKLGFTNLPVKHLCLRCFMMKSVLEMFG